MSAASVIPASVLSLLLLAPPIQAEKANNEGFPNTIKDSRYVSVQIGATAAQTNVLKSVVQITIPNHITTVGAALQYLIKPYGYELDDEIEAGEASGLYVLLTRALPDPHRELHSMTLQDALNVLGGESFDLVINPVLRTVSYHLKPEQNSYVSDNDRTEAQAHWSERNKPVSISLDEESSPLAVYGYGPIKPGDTLSHIVMQFEFADLTLDQALVHAYRSNPKAFVDDNMNHLVVGAYLSVSSTRDEVLPPAAASRLVDEHYSRWLQQVQP